MKKRTRVVSISLPPELLSSIDRLQDRPGFSGRSEVVRAGLHALIQRMEETPSGDGPATATLTLGYHGAVAQRVTRLRHVYDDVIRTIMHTHRDDGSCLEVLMLAGPADRITALEETLLGREGISLVALVWVPAVADVIAEALDEEGPEVPDDGTETAHAEPSNDARTGIGHAH